jgi:hypothetical protein
MTDFNASTPQVKFVKKLFRAYCSLDLNNLGPIPSKNYQCEVLSERADFPKQMKESQIKVWGPVFSLLNKLEVRIRHRGNISKLRPTSTTPRRSIQE